jgi:hypothetical protein
MEEIRFGILLRNRGPAGLHGLDFLKSSAAIRALRKPGVIPLLTPRAFS